MIKISIYKKQREFIKNTIIQTAINLFKEKGYENVTVDEITTQVGIAKGTFYNYFESKGDLLIYWASKCFANFDIHQTMDKTKSAEENLCCLLKIYVKAICEERSLFTSFIKKIGTINAIQSDGNKDFNFIELLKATISNSYDGADILTGKSELKIQIINSVMFSAIVGWVCSDNEIDGLGDYLAELIKICLYGMFEKGGGKDD